MITVHPDSIPVLNATPLDNIGKRSSRNMFLVFFLAWPGNVKAVILGMSNKCSGIDEVSVKIYKLLVDKLSYGISFIFNVSVEQGVFPQNLYPFMKQVQVQDRATAPHAVGTWFENG